MVVGPTGSGKSALLAFLALQWFRYPDARVVFFDKGRSARAATLAAGGRWRAMEPSSAELYRGFGLNRRQLELIAFAPPKRSYYWRQPRGRRLFDLRLTGVALALCGAGTPEDQTLIDDVLARSGEAAFAREFLKAKGVQNVDSVFDAFDPPLAAE